MGSQIHPSRQIDAGTLYGHNSVVPENVHIGDSRERTTPTGSHIHPSCQIGAGTRYGHNTVISENVRIGTSCQIGHGVVIHADTVIGNDVRIDDNSVIGKLPMKAALSAITKEQELPPCEVADSCLVGTLTILYRGCKLGNKVMVADLASIRENVQVGEYTIVGRGVTVENNVKIGKRCKLETESYITALSEIEDGCFIAPEVTFTNDNFLGRTKERFKFHKGVTVKRGGRIGANVTVLPGLTIGADALVAAGSVVTRDVPAKKIVMGSPAKVKRDVPVEQLLDNQ